MDVIIDTSALIAVIVVNLNAIELFENYYRKYSHRTWFHSLGNWQCSFPLCFKQNRLTIKEAQKGLAIFQSIPLRYVEADFSNVLKLSKNATYMLMMHISWIALSGAKHRC